MAARCASRCGGSRVLASWRKTVGRGLAAGALGTAAMTAWQEASARLVSAGKEGQASGDGESALGAQEQSSGPREQASADRWEHAPAPAQVARLILRSVFGVEVGPDQIGLLTNVSHWAYGTGWGPVYALLRRSSARRPLRAGLWFGAGVWAMSYVQLVPLGIYKPPWKYPPGVLGLDLSYHLAYGAGVGLGYEVLGAVR